MTPYHETEAGVLYLGDCLDVMAGLPDGCADAVVTDPPYPNNAGHFREGIPAAEEFLRGVTCPALVFWSELTQPPVPLPLVAVHIWHRTNVNGRPYEPIYQYHPDGQKRRSQVKEHAAVFGGVGPGCSEYLGHPTQKPVALMAWLLLGHTARGDAVLDPFAGVGATLAACMRTGRSYIGIELSEAYCEIAARRIEKALAQPRLPLDAPLEKPRTEALAI
jgi:DNA modification methylase